MRWVLSQGGALLWLVRAVRRRRAVRSSGVNPPSVPWAPAPSNHPWPGSKQVVKESPAASSTEHGDFSSGPAESNRASASAIIPGLGSTGGHRGSGAAGGGPQREAQAGMGGPLPGRRHALEIVAPLAPSLEHEAHGLIVDGQEDELVAGAHPQPLRTQGPPGDSLREEDLLHLGAGGEVVEAIRIERQVSLEGRSGHEGIEPVGAVVLQRGTRAHTHVV